jgi:phytanoyl-CoA dioxygenase PhyH
MNAPVQDLPLDTRFRLGDRVSAAEQRFFERWGFLHYEGFAAAAEVAELLAALGELDTLLVAQRRQRIRGIPIRYGRDVDGRRIVQRFAFTSLLSEPFHRFLRNGRFDPLGVLAGQEARLGEEEKDGLVVNHYVNASQSGYRQLGWHTDAPRDIFLHRRLPGPMLNVGVYLDDSPREKGGLRLIPGSQRQGLFHMLFGKAYFVDTRPDSREICLEARAGDLTVHDGRLWHRVARASVTGEPSRRRVMYVPFVTGPYEPKREDSPVPIYHRLSGLFGR